MQPRINPADRAVIAEVAWRLGPLAIRINCRFANKNPLSELAQPLLNRIQQCKELVRLHRAFGSVARGAVLPPRVMELLAIFRRVQEIERRKVEMSGMPIRLAPRRVPVGQDIITPRTALVRTAQAHVKDPGRFQS